MPSVAGVDLEGMLKDVRTPPECAAGGHASFGRLSESTADRSGVLLTVTVLRMRRISPSTHRCFLWGT